MARALLLMNPIATRTHPTAAAAVQAVFRKAGWQTDLVETVAPGDSYAFSRRAVEDGTDVIAVFGGDGTTMQVARALVGTDVTLGLVPGGTGNVLAGNLRIPMNPVRAAELLVRGRPRRIDLGRLERSDGIHYFGVACGAGADARIMGGTATHEKRRWGIGGYFATLFRQLPLIRSSDYAMEVDGKAIHFRAALAMVLNCGELIPPLVRVRREARPDDGLLDLLVVAADSPWQCARGVFRAIQNTYFGTGETPYLMYGQGREITIRTAAPEPVQYDGDVMGETPVTATVVPGALCVVAPGA
jgi:diacylglycerol kinase (ATP)